CQDSPAAIRRVPRGPQSGAPVRPSGSLRLRISWCHFKVSRSIAACTIPPAVSRSDASARIVVLPAPMFPVITMTGTCSATHAYRFCPDPRCAVVYFGEDGTIFTTSDLRERVWQKEPPGHRTVCYCFGENEADIAAELDQRGQSDAVQRVRDHIAAGRCACEIRNPRGACCLGDVTAAVEHLRPARVSEA